MQVRSDFKVTLQLRDAQGKVHTIGSYDAEHVATEGDEAVRPIPHLQRLSPDGRWLASLDADRMRLDVRAVDGSRPDGDGSLHDPMLVKLEGVEGTVRQIRFLEAMPGLVLVSDANVYLLPFAPETHEGGPIQAEPIFDPARTADMEFLDTRILPEGLIAHVREHVGGDPFWHRGEVYWIRIADETVQEVVPLVPSHLSASAANVRSEGRIVIAMSVHDYEIAEHFEQQDLSELWTIETPDGDVPRVSAVTPCASDYCNVINWAPGARRLTYAMDWSEVIREGATPEAEPIRMTLELPDDTGGRMHTLWADASEQQLLGANHDGIQVWSSEGEPRWQWQHPRGYAVHFADFEVDGSVLVAAGTQLWRVRDGKGKRLLRTRGEHAPHRNPGEGIYDEDGWDTGIEHSFIDDAIALPDGSIAFSVVDLNEKWEETESEWGDSKIFEAPAPPWDGEELTDPFARAPAPAPPPSQGP